MPHPEASISLGPPTQRATFQAESDEKVYAIPAFGLSVPITTRPPFWRFGFAGYGVSGMGVDYRNTILDPSFTGGMPPVAGEYTELSIMKFAPSIAFQPFERASFGLAVHVDYGMLDLRQGTSSNYGIGAQLGMIYRITDDLSFGLSYVSPQNINYESVVDFSPPGVPGLGLSGLELQSPNQLGVGLAWNGCDRKLLLETDIKWLNWSGAKGYEDFDWKDQIVVAVGAQYKVTPKLALRAGYNYGNNPVKEHNGFNPVGFSSVEGNIIPTYAYESFRIVGFPAIVEHHVTAGVGYDFSQKFGVNLGYMHAFENTVSETDAFNTVKFESSLSEDSADVSFVWRF
jgi:long-chain fatty acid transport protein